MLPYLIAGAIGYGIAKLFEEDESPKYADGGSVLLAPNGKPSNLTPEQYKLVREPAFKKWFGDWENDPENSSKVVDKNGEPKVKWRGDNNPKNVFDYINYGGHGVYYFGDKDFAESFGDKLNSYFINSKIPFLPYSHLKGKKLKEIKDLWKNDAEIILKQSMASQGYREGNIQDLHDYLENYYLWDKETGWFLNKDVKMKSPDYTYSLDILLFKLQGGINFYLLERKEIIEWIKNNNYDGYESYEGNGDNIAVFNSNQIKLADGTNNTFDSNNPDIRFAGGGEIESVIEQVELEVDLSYYKQNIQYHSLYPKLKNLNFFDDEEKVTSILVKGFINDVKAKSELVNGKIRLYRALAIKNIEKLNVEKLGIYWSVNEDKTGVFDDEGYEHKEKPNYKSVFIIRAEFNTKDIDWQNSFDLYVMNDWMEGEIRVVDGSEAYNLKIKKSGDKKWLNI